MAEMNWKLINKTEATKFVEDFYRTAYDWRSQGYHDNWDTYERNYHNIYDPTILTKKESWQSTMFAPLTMKDIEVVASALVKILMGSREIVNLKRREMGDELQASLWTELLKYDIDISKYPVTFYDIVKEALIFGSGFAKIYWRKRVEDRRVKSIVKYGILDAIKEGKVPWTFKGFEEKVDKVTTYDACEVCKVHIRDIFLEPNSLNLDRVLQRDSITYGELLSWSKAGYVDKESVEALRDVIEGDKFEEDCSTIENDLGNTDPTLVRPKFDKKHTIFEFWGPIPKKWIDLSLNGDSDEGNTIVQGKIMIASGRFFLGSELNPNADMKPPYLKMDYIRSGRTYGIGIAQILKGLQEEYNEIRNQRMDNVSLLMNKVAVILDKAIIDPNELVSKPMAVWRLKGNLEEADVKKMMTFLDPGDVALSAYKEVYEIERQAQEADGANRVTLGSAGSVKDTNQTLGGMELLRQAAYDRFAVYAYIMGKTFIEESAKKMIFLINQNRNEESIRKILGEMPIEVEPGLILAKYETLKPINSDDLIMFYDFCPASVFDQENKNAKSITMKSFIQLCASILPGFNPLPALKQIGALDGLTQEELFEVLGEDIGRMPTPMAQGMGVPSLANQGKEGGSAPSPTAPPMGSANIPFGGA